MLDGLRVLVVDGHRDTAELYREFLGGRGADVQTAVLGSEAVALVGPSWSPHVLVTELRLPDMDGEALARVIARRSGHRLGLVAATADEQRMTAPSARARGFVRCLVKPIDLYELASAVALAALTARVPALSA